MRWLAGYVRMYLLSSFLDFAPSFQVLRGDLGRVCSVALLLEPGPRPQGLPRAGPAAFAGHLGRRDRLGPVQQRAGELGELRGLQLESCHARGHGVHGGDILEHQRVRD